MSETLNNNTGIVKLANLCGRIISHSKSHYLSQHENNFVLFNANVATRTNGKIWYGDLDITVSADDLVKWAVDQGEPLYIFREMDGRFENEANLNFDRAVAIVTNNKIEDLRKVNRL